VRYANSLSGQWLNCGTVIFGSYVVVLETPTIAAGNAHVSAASTNRKPPPVSESRLKLASNTFIRGGDDRLT
jgi:hypothetical protein